jgi:hypothetical protein
VLLSHLCCCFSLWNPEYQRLWCKRRRRHAWYCCHYENFSSSQHFWPRLHGYLSRSWNFLDW